MNERVKKSGDTLEARFILPPSPSFSRIRIRYGAKLYAVATSTSESADVQGDHTPCDDPAAPLDPGAGGPASALRSGSLAPHPDSQPTWQTKCAQHGDGRSDPAAARGPLPSSFRLPPLCSIELTGSPQKWEESPLANVILFKGTGKNFCAGGDVKGEPNREGATAPCRS